MRMRERERKRERERIPSGRKTFDERPSAP